MSHLIANNFDLGVNFQSRLKVKVIFLLETPILDADSERAERPK